MMEKRLIIFDADGTLIDSENDVFECFNHILRTNAEMEITKQEFRKMAGLTLEQTYEGVLPEDKRDLVRELTDKYRHYYIDEGHSLDTTTLFPDVSKTIEGLKEKGFLLVIASSKAKRALEPMLKHFGLTEKFDLVVATGATNVKHKPDPEVIYYILDSLNIDAKDAVMVGDTKSDILAGKNAGIDTIAVTYGYEEKEILVSSEPTYIIDEFSKLSELIEYRD